MPYHSERVRHASDSLDALVIPAVAIFLAMLILALVGGC